jgi:excisionase family DNA binding protein
MAAYRRADLSVDEAAQLLRVQPETIRRRVRSKELRAGPAGGVRLTPQDDWVRVEDASALLGVAPATVRASIARGRLTGRREEHGRWRVQLLSVLEDRRCEVDARRVFGDVEHDASAGHDASARSRSDGGPEGVAGGRGATRRGRSSRDVFVRLYDDEPELLERAAARHGSNRAAVVEGLRAIDDDAASSVDVAELRAAYEIQGEQLERVRTAHRNLSAHARRRMVDEVHCHHCERLVSIEELDEHELEDGTMELFHKKHGHRPAGKLGRPSTVVARRAPLADERDA